jgi:hypothetical protein
MLFPRAVQMEGKRAPNKAVEKVLNINLSVDA